MTVGLLSFAALALNNNRVTINVPPGGFMNLAKGVGFNLAPSIIDTNGYPTSTPPTANSTIPMVPNYYGQYVWKWTGTGSMQFGGQAAIIYDGGAFVGLGGNTGAIVSNFGILTTGGANPRVAFKFGGLVASVSGGSGSLVTVTTASSLNFGGGFGTGSQISFAVGASANLVNGPNSDGSWTITNVSGTQFTLNGSTGVVSPTVTGAGGVGVQTEAILQIGSASLSYLNSGTFSGFTNLVICTLANESAVNGGQIYDPVLVGQLQYLMNSASRGSPGWLRFMDVSGVQGSYECDSAQRATPSTQCFGGLAFPPAYQAGTLTRAAGDAYTCANPSGSPASGAPIDCEIIQGTPSATNTGGSPTLAITGRTGTWPIIDGVNPFIFRFSAGPASAGLTMQFTFTASWLNGGVAYVKNYTTVAGDVGSVSTLNANLQTAFVADATLTAGKIAFTNSAQLVASPRTPLGGALTISYTSGPAICTIVQIDVGTISTSPSTFIFNALLGGFIYRGNQGMVRSIPFEAIAELCNRVGANCWFNWPIYTKGQFITDTTTFFANNLTGLKFGAEMGNEIWNGNAQLFARAQAYGASLNIATSSDAAPYAWQGLRTVQYAAISRAAWNALRASNQHYVLTMSPTFDAAVSSNFDSHVLQGVDLTTTNTIYASFGGLGGTSTASFNAAGSQPVDSSDAIGLAPYWNSHWLGAGSFTTAANVSGPVSENAPWLQAAKDYSNGLFSTAFASMVNQFNGSTTRASGSNFGQNFLDFQAIFTQQEAQAAQYDARRIAASKTKLAIMHYEDGPSFGVGNDGNNGVNSVNSTDISALALRMGAGGTVPGGNTFAGLNWTSVAAFTHTGADDKTEMATMVFTMLQAWKNDLSYKNMIKTSRYQQLVSVSGANRETRPAQFGYSAGNWCLFPVSYQIGNQYQNYDAIHEFNA